MNEIDDTSETILSVLAGHGGEADVGSIKDAIDNRRPNGDEIHYSSIHYRCSPERDGALFEEGLVEPVGTDPRSGGTRDATIYTLADDALQRVERRDDVDIRDARDAEEVVEAVESVKETVAEFDERLKELEDRINSLETEVDANEREISRLQCAKLETNDLREALSGWKESIDHAVATADAAEERSKENEKTIQELDNQLYDIREFVGESGPDLPADDLASSVASNRSFLEEMWGALDVSRWKQLDYPAFAWAKRVEGWRLDDEGQDDIFSFFTDD